MTMQTKRALGGLSVGALCALSTLAFPAISQGQVLQRFALRAELGAGTMLSEHQRTTLGYDSVQLQLTGRLAFNVIDWLSLQASVNNGLFFSSRDNIAMGRTLALQGGLRLEPMLGRVGRLWLDGNFGFVLTGDDQRFGLDAGLGFEFQAAKWLGIGPFARYHHVTQDPQNRHPHDAQFWSAGVSLSLRVPAEERAPEPVPVVVPPRDTDGDGVMDPDDQCVQVPQGDHPDPARRGCPLTDSDSDGVYDNVDQCIHEAQGDHPDPARAGCPDHDTDADGVFDAQDQCRDVPQGDHPDPDPARLGCPIADRDGDSVPDATDHCPDQPGAPHTNPARNGCPGLVRVQNGMLQILAPVFFATNRDTILPRSFPVLEAVATALQASPDIRHVSVEGHTDDVGDDERNLSLSQRRAWSVVEYLHQHGIEAPRMRAQGMGETRPVRPIEGLRGRALRDARGLNRRVEFRIVRE
ncbi:MAG: OmpA family protein [Deltaproteobacteria bacterium]|nr:OmpA family protein [Deltaproteobacteria bacterium]